MNMAGTARVNTRFDGTKTIMTLTVAACFTISLKVVVKRSPCTYMVIFTQLVAVPYLDAGTTDMMTLSIQNTQERLGRRTR